MKNVYGANRHRCGTAMRAMAWAVTAALGTCSAVHATEIDTGNPDISIRWDNTIRYNLGHRAHSQDQSILNSPNNDDGDRNFGNHSIVTNRVDLVSEFDFVYKKNYGFRLSANGWYDQAYSSLDNTHVSSSNHIVNGKPALGLPNYTQRYFEGPSGQLLDAFAFANFDIGGVNVNTKAGRYDLFWGEALLNPIHSLSYGQSPLDIGKLLTVPGATAKELFRPRTQVSAQVQATPTLSFEGQYYFRWEQVYYPESGSYMDPNDAVLKGGQSIYINATQRALRGPDVTPKNQGDWGVSMHWSPEAIDSTIGLYYRNTSDIQPQFMLAPAVAPNVPAAACKALGYKSVTPTICYINPAMASVPQILQGNIGKYMANYADGIDIYGASFAKQILGISFSAEVNYRHNMPLVSIPVQLLPTPLANKVVGAINTMPTDGNVAGARGDTWHAVTDFAGVVPKTPVFDTANYVVEFVWSRWDKVTQNPNAFEGTSPGYAGIDKPTRNYTGTQLSFTPTWFQVYPGVDLLAPMTYTMGLSGNSAVTFGGNKGMGNFSFGVGADVRQKYRFDLKYIGYIGRVAVNQAGVVTSSAGLASLLRDRNYIDLTFQTTF
ncbi:DUF1302 domain-containing protein [Dyella jiangningensis]|uniref:DUF1302 domain-containing protein n=1 Tax=Dyella jiangningensis TaxID=1379159 RepID=UPI0009E0AAF7|nr:DUF1302 domain-containing protein [Dyella jiangningensis]MDG2538932.1 DUF1302 domain-containing protein [Dyella jiangningensis]